MDHVFFRISYFLSFWGMHIFTRPEVKGKYAPSMKDTADMKKHMW